MRQLPTRKPRFLALLAALAGLCGSPSASIAATGLPPGFQDVVVATGLQSPTAMQFAPDGRIFVAQQGGQLRIVKNGVLLPTPFLTVTVSSLGERGLLGVALDPSFASNQFVYIYYTATTPTVHNRISRFKASGDIADAGVGEVILLDFDDLGTATNHNGGAIHFGLDGKLYAGHGENAVGTNAQSMNNLLGKIIRMNPVQDPVAQIPTDNPFYSTASGKNRLIWALGLRNPFTFGIQPGTGLTYVNDVGAGSWEEIDDVRAGRNFGWPVTEGPFNAATYPQFTNPVYSYHHSSGSPNGCAITGGAFYNPPVSTFPASYVGKYFFADFCDDWIYYIDPASPSTATRFASAVSSPVDLKVGADGALYYLARGSGSIGKIVPPSAPQITQQPASRSVPVGATATFTVSAIGTTPLSFQWQKNGVDIPGATSASYTTPPVSAADHHSTYRCRVTNFVGTATSNSATLTVPRDFDGDGSAELAVFRPANGFWFVLNSSTGYGTWTTDQWGANGDVPVSGDYDGDGRLDLAVYRPPIGTWFIRTSATNYTQWMTIPWGGGADIPIAGDYDGDGRADVTVYRPDIGTWFILKSSTSYEQWTTIPWGAATDIPMSGDFDGDGRSDIVVYRPSSGLWFILRSSTAYTTWDTLGWGTSGDRPVPGDYDGDGRTDLAVFRPAAATWFVLESRTNYAGWSTYAWGAANDIPVPQDYDGDGKADLGVFRPSTATWFILKSSMNYASWITIQWGAGTDLPIVQH